MKPKVGTTITSTPEPESSTPAWLITFADTMSLLLTFFVMLISFSSTEQIKITESMRSIQKFLGGGAKAGGTKIKASYNMSKTDLSGLTQSLGVKVSNLPIPYDSNDEPMHFNIIESQKLNALKEMLKDNPALLSILIQKQSSAQLKTINAEKEDHAPAPEEITLESAQVELSLQNLEHYIVSEQLDTMVEIKRNDSGEISFEIDCNALYNETSDMLRPESEILLLRIAKILRMIPNKVAIENIDPNAFEKQNDISEQWSLSLSRSERIIRFFLTAEPEINKDRFSLMVRKEDTTGSGMIAEDDTDKSIIGIRICAFRYGDF